MISLIYIAREHIEKELIEGDTYLLKVKNYEHISFKICVLLKGSYLTIPVYICYGVITDNKFDYIIEMYNNNNNNIGFSCVQTRMLLFEKVKQINPDFIEVNR